MTTFPLTWIRDTASSRDLEAWLKRLWDCQQKFHFGMLFLTFRYSIAVGRDCPVREHVAEKSTDSQLFSDLLNSYKIFTILLPEVSLRMLHLTYLHSIKTVLHNKNVLHKKISNLDSERRSNLKQGFFSAQLRPVCTIFLALNSNILAVCFLKLLMKISKSSVAIVMQMSNALCQ